MFYIISTPIGNLDDITKRATDILGKVDYIFAENITQSKTLLSKLSIKKPLAVCNQKTESKAIKAIISLLLKNKDIALISSSGTPLINDPGYLAVREVIKNNIPYTVIPGPCAVINALVLSGFSAIKFKFNGFVPITRQAIVNFIIEILDGTETNICFVQPHKLEAVFTILSDRAPNAPCALVKEMTKIYENVYIGPMKEIKDKLTSGEIAKKGEYVLVIPPLKKPKDTLNKPIIDMADLLQKELGDKKTSLLVGKYFGINNKVIYNYLLKSK